MVHENVEKIRNAREVTKTYLVSVVSGARPSRHADPKTTMRYYRNRDNMDDNAVDYIYLSV